MPVEKVRYEEMLPHEIVRRREQFSAAFIGLGGVEWHGEHLAVGNDALKAEKLCELAAARSGGFAFPRLWYGEPRVACLMEANADDCERIREKMRFRHGKFALDYFPTSPEQQEQFFQTLVTQILVQMNTLEMVAVCLLTGHYPLGTWAQPVVERFNGMFEDTKAFVGKESDYCPQCEEVGADHAARWETSYLMYLRPECVDMNVYRGREDELLVGVGGADPRVEASKETGRKACDLIVDGMVKKAGELLATARAH